MLSSIRCVPLRSFQLVILSSLRFPRPAVLTLRCLTRFFCSMPSFLRPRSITSSLHFFLSCSRSGPLFLSTFSYFVRFSVLIRSLYFLCSPFSAPLSPPSSCSPSFPILHSAVLSLSYGPLPSFFFVLLPSTSFSSRCSWPVHSSLSFLPLLCRLPPLPILVLPLLAPFLVFGSLSSFSSLSSVRYLFTPFRLLLTFHSLLLCCSYSSPLCSFRVTPSAILV